MGPAGKIPESTGIARYNSQFCHSFAVRIGKEKRRTKIYFTHYQNRNPAVSDSNNNNKNKVEQTCRVNRQQVNNNNSNKDNNNNNNLTTTGNND